MADTAHFISAEPAADTVQSVSPKTGRVRAMAPDDISEVGQIFYKVFRHRTDGGSSDDFNSYARQIFFGCPSYDAANGGIVHVSPTGAIDAAIAVVPMKITACNRVLTGRLMCAFMADPDSRTGGAAKLALTVRSRAQDFCFSDTASQQSADHVRAVGGMILPVQSLEWLRVFRPAAYAASRLSRASRSMAGLPLRQIARPFDAMLRGVWPAPRRLTRQAGVISPMADEDFITCAPSMVARFAVHPSWSRTELRWLLAMARLNVRPGPLSLNAVHSPDGELAGCFAWYGCPGAEALVLNILTRRGAESLVIQAMMDHLQGMGCVSASGMAQPFLLDAFDCRPGLVYRLRNHVWVSTRHADIRAAIRRDDVYLGGLAGETWSRLLSDFT